jgi:hypothetical protein
MFRFSSPKRTLAVFAAMTITVIVGASGAGALEPISPSMELSRSSVVAGQSITISGTNWPASQVVAFALCGNNGESGSAGCDSARSVTVGADRSGNVIATLQAGNPPVACPCVVRGFSSAVSASQPVTLVGAPIESRPPAGVAMASIDSATIVNSDGYVSWFGGVTDRAINVKVSNPSQSPVIDTRIEVRWSSPFQAASTLIVPGPSRLEPGESVNITIPFTIGSFGWGPTQVRARPVAMTETGWTELTTTVIPWGLIVVMVLFVQVMVFVALGRNRRARLEMEAIAAQALDAIQTNALSEGGIGSQKNAVDQTAGMTPDSGPEKKDAMT